MHLTLPRQLILQTVQRCQSIVEKRHTVPILSNILLHAEGDNLIATATDLEVGIRTRTAATVKTGGSVTVSARKLFEIIKELDADKDVEFVTEEAFLSIRSGSSKFRLATLPADDYPSLPEDSDGVKIVLEGPDLADMIAATSFAMSSDETRKYLTGTLFEVNQGVLNLVATDGHRLAIKELALASGINDCQAIVPRKAVMEIRRLSEEATGQVVLTISDRQVRLIAGDHELGTKVIDARFPVYQDVIPQDNPQTATLEISAFDQVLRRSMIVANEFTHDVRLLFTDEGVHVSAHNTEQEEASEFVKAEFSGKEINIGFNARYLRDALGVMGTGQVVVHLKDSLSPVILSAASDSAARYVVMPMRI